MYKTLSYSLDLLKEEHIPFILNICNEQLGDGFLSEAELQHYLDNETKFCHVVQHSNQVAGFSLMEISDKSIIAKKMRSEEQWFLNYFAAYDKIGYRSLTAVSNQFQGKGVASFLVEKGLHFLSQKTDVVVCDAWKSETTHIGNILERNSYEVLKEVPQFWTAESINKQYQCGVCGAPPCECTAVIYARFFNRRGLHWWERSDLKYQEGQLTFNNINILSYIKNKETPLYIYDVDRVVHKYEGLVEALSLYDVDFNIYYAMKANRHPAILSHLIARTNIGIDVCSPNELDLAQQYGFEEKQITYTGTSLSKKDLDSLAKHPDININFDSLSSIRRFSNMNIKRDIGIRINANIGMAYNQSLEYSGNDIVKFGIYQEQWAELVALIKKSPLTVTTVHCHSGSGFLTEQLLRLPYIFDKIDKFLELFPNVKTLNLGGGLGVPQKKGDQILDLDKWAAIVCEYASKKGLKLAFEPGDYMVKDAGILITEVNTVEKKVGRLFVCIDAGMNMNNEYAYYDMNLETVPLIENNKTKLKTTLSGNINEPVDLFSEDKLMPPFQEGDLIALLNSGGYGASSSSNHCMRGDFKEYVITNKK